MVNLNISVTDDEGNDLIKMRVEEVTWDGSAWSDYSCQVAQKLPNGDIGVQQWGLRDIHNNYGNLLMLLYQLLEVTPHDVKMEGHSFRWNFDLGPLSLPGQNGNDQ